MAIQPFLLGRGRAGSTMEVALQILSNRDPELEILPAKWLSRDQKLNQVDKGRDVPVLLIANPHGLHAQTILEAQDAGFAFMACEKPVCVSLSEAKELAAVTATVAVFHGYRMMWGPQTLRRMIDTGEIGDVLSIEGRYWQSSAAERALTAEKKIGWKDDPKLAGYYDTLIDIGSHWVDLVFYLLQEIPERGRGWLSYANTPSAHRDTHVHLQFSFPKGQRALASISKNFHGATNQLEIHVLGSKRAASWSFLSPDEITIGEGRDRRIVTRHEATLGAHLPPFHGMGWTEGYLEISRRLLRVAKGNKTVELPTLKESLAVMKFLLGIEYERT